MATLQHFLAIAASLVLAYPTGQCCASGKPSLAEESACCHPGCSFMGDSVDGNYEPAIECCCFRPVSLPDRADPAVDILGALAPVPAFLIPSGRLASATQAAVELRYFGPRLQLLYCVWLQ